MSLEHFSVPEKKEVFKTYANKQTNKFHNGESMSKGHTQKPIQRAPNGQSWDDVYNKISGVAMDYNSKYKINIHESIWMYIND